VAGVAALALVGSLLFGVVVPRPRPPVAYLWVDDGLVTRQALLGFDKAVTEFRLVSQKVSKEAFEEDLINRLGDEWWAHMSEAEAEATYVGAEQDVLRKLLEDGTGFIIANGIPDEALAPVASLYPNAKFASSFAGSGPSNIAFLTSIDSEPSYLAGAVAALTTKTGTIGFVGAVDWRDIWAFHAGFEAGARSINPDIVIFADYLSGTDTFSGFNDSPGANASATNMYRHGADVIFHAAGNSGLGVFDAAVMYTSETGRHVWAIGVDSDQYETVLGLPGATNPGAWREHILTSVLKGIDTGTYDVVASYVTNTFTGGIWSRGLTFATPGISYSGGYIDALRPLVDDIRTRIVAGTIDVPCIPTERIDEAAALGLTPDNCPVATR